MQKGVRESVFTQGTAKEAVYPKLTSRKKSMRGEKGSLGPRPSQGL